MIDQDSFRDDEIANLPVFPLPRVVLFPGAMLPLHLFEPRYRRLAIDCMREGPRAMAIALLAPGWEHDYEGCPPVAPVCGAGRIVVHEEQPDGTHDIVLRGVSRVRLEELPRGDLPYRRARAQVLPDHSDAATPGEVRTLIAVATRVSEMIGRRRRTGPPGGPSFDLGLDEATTDSLRIDCIADRLLADTALRQRILETQNLTARARLVSDAVSEVLARLAGPGSRSTALA